MDIYIAAAAIMRDDGATLLVRKRGTSSFMQPGGKIDGGETAVAALCRELFEELGLHVRPGEPKYLGRFTAPAANEPGYQVIADLFSLRRQGHIEAKAEIAETIWILPGETTGIELAPLTRDVVLPAIWKAQ